MNLPTGISLEKDKLLYNKLSVIRDEPNLDILNLLYKILSFSKTFIISFSDGTFGIVYSDNPKILVKYKDFFNKEQLIKFLKRNKTNSLVLSSFNKLKLEELKKIVPNDSQILKEYIVSKKQYGPIRVF